MDFVSHNQEVPSLHYSSLFRPLIPPLANYPSHSARRLSMRELARALKLAASLLRVRDNLGAFWVSENDLISNWPRRRSRSSEGKKNAAFLYLLPH